MESANSPYANKIRNRKHIEIMEKNRKIREIQENTTEKLEATHIPTYFSKGDMHDDSTVPPPPPPNNRSKRGRKRKSKRNRRRNNRRNVMGQQLSVKRNSSLGIETRTALLSGIFEETANNKKQINLASVFNGTEAISVFKNWLYGKILSVSVTFYPNNLNTSNDPLYMIIVWSPEEPLYLTQMNNVKIVPAYRIGFKSYTYKVPLFESQALLLKFYKSVIDLPNVEFYLYIHSPGNTDVWKFRVDIKIRLKGSKILNNQTKLVGKLVDQLEELKIEEEDEKEEIEGDHKELDSKQIRNKDDLSSSLNKEL